MPEVTRRARRSRLARRETPLSFESATGGKFQAKGLKLGTRTSGGVPLSKQMLSLPIVRFFLCNQRPKEKSLAKKKCRGLFRSLRRATAERGGSAKPFEKGLSENDSFGSS